MVNSVHQLVNSEQLSRCICRSETGEFTTGMRKDNLSELVCAQTRPTKQSVSASKVQAAPSVFAGCDIYPCLFPEPPALDRQEWAPRPGVTG